MAVSDSVRGLLAEKGWTHQQLADHLHHERSYVTKMLAGDRPWPETLEPKLSGLHWTIAAKIGEERSGGYFINPIGKITNIDRHYAVTGLMLEKETMEFLDALRKLIAFRHADPNVRQERADQLWLEMRDMELFANLMRGHLEDDFGVDRAALIKRHEYELQTGER